MDFNLSEIEQAVLETARDFAQKKVKPLARELDESGRFPEELVREMGELGLMGVYVPEAWGGAGGTALAYNLAVMEISKACASTGVILSAHTSLCIDPILKHGTDAQKEKYLKPLASGKYLGAYALTEPNSGSDAAALSTTFVDRGDHFEITGNKLFVTNGAHANVYIVYATSDKRLGHHGISAFIVEPSYAGFARGKSEHKLGINASSTTELILSQCKVPKENLLGTLGKGFNVALETLDGGRIGIAAQALGIGKAALETAVKHVKTREQFGAPLAKLQAIQWMIADSATELEAAELLMMRAAKLKDLAGRRYTKEAAMAKLYASEAAFRAADRGLQMHGGYGFIKDYDAERHYRDVRICRLYEGTSEIQRLVIAANVLKEIG
ncbi:MAG TPA: acyl-CoA dehydrogenase family protein [Planctomycetota bacterium]|nr:acyl-CoA dehydrogenase family protein [Planctomycetota bacterium]